MPRRLEFEDVKSYIEAREYKLCSTEYINTTTKLTLLCPQNHTWAVQFNSFQQGNRCRECSKHNYRYTFEEVKAYISDYGFTLHSTEYITNKHPLNLICPIGHSCSVRFNDFKRGTRCGKCSGVAKLNFEEVKAYIEATGYKLQSTEYINNRQFLDLHCPQNHLWSVTYRDFQQGVRCAKCSGSLKHTLEDIKAYVEAKGYTLLSSEYISNKHKLDLLCTKGHSWSIIFNSIQQGNRCQQCILEAYRGKGSPHWKHSISDEERAMGRNYLEYREWRKAVYERDRYKCVLCSSKGRLVAHHLYGYRANPHLRTKLSNGVTLCQKCHRHFHSLFGNKNNTKAEFEKFRRNDFKKQLLAY